MDQHTKSCPTCKKTLPRTSFAKSKHKKDGFAACCKACNNAHSKKMWHAGTRKKQQDKNRHKLTLEKKLFVRQYFAEHPCVDCGETDPLILEFDHVRGEKRINVYRIIASQCLLPILIKEIEKCDVRCINCHRKKTAIQFGWYDFTKQESDYKNRECFKTAERKKRNRLFVFNYLSTHPCIDCGETNYTVLEFDHVRGKKKRAISRCVQLAISINYLKREISKCEVRCANCHKRKTAKQFGFHKDLKVAARKAKHKSRRDER